MNPTRIPHISIVQVEVTKEKLLEIHKESKEPIEKYAWDNAPFVSFYAQDKTIILFFFTNEIFTDDEKNIIKIV
jgi:hypothetical protein